MKWFAQRSKASLLTKQLANYPPYRAPHTAHHLSLTEAQALQNLNYLLAVKSHRVDAFQALVADQGIDIKSVIRGGDHNPVIEALYGWAQTEWPQLVPGDVARRSVWRETYRHSAHIIYSVAMDCAIVLGEIVVSRRPAFQWAVDLDADNVKDEMPSARRVVLQAPSMLHPGQSVIIDWEELVVVMLFKPQSAANRAINLWQRVCSEAIDGATQGEGVGK